VSDRASRACRSSAAASTPSPPERSASTGSSLCAVNCAVRGLALNGSDRNHAPTSAWIQTLPGSKTTIGDVQFGKDTAGPFLQLDGGVTRVENCTGNGRQAIVATDGASLLGGGNTWIHETSNTADDAIDISAISGPGMVDYGPDIFQDSGTPFRRSLYNVSAPSVSGKYRWCAEFDTSVSGPVASAGRDSVPVERTNRQEQPISGVRADLGFTRAELEWRAKHGVTTTERRRLNRRARRLLARAFGAVPPGPHGFDVSSYQPAGPNFRQGGRSFAIFKATEATSYFDPHFNANRAAAHAQGCTAIGIYHFARPGSSSADAQWAWMSAHVGAPRPGEFIVLDYEVGPWNQAWIVASSNWPRPPGGTSPSTPTPAWRPPTRPTSCARRRRSTGRPATARTRPRPIAGSTSAGRSGSTPTALSARSTGPGTVRSPTPAAGPARALGASGAAGTTASATQAEVRLRGGEHVLRGHPQAQG
jgi:hypothetical protein